jgi:arylsulfatase A-like enzyme
MRRVIIALVVVASAGAALWRHGGSPSPAHVVIITLDTTRADRLSPYGFADSPMPGLERLAREGVVFDQAMSVAPLTLPAHTSLFTGLFPPHHDVRDNAAPALAARYTTLAETLSSHGYCTGAFVSSVVLAPDRGLQQGFERYLSVPVGENGRETSQRRADKVIDDAIR